MKRGLAASICLGSVAGLGLLVPWKSSAHDADVVVERHVAAMGTTLDIEVTAGSRTEGLAASERALRAIENTEARLSTWRDDTELARWNAAPFGAAYELSPALARDFRAALDCARETEGAFDPTVGALVEAWQLRGRPVQPNLANLLSARAATGWSFVSLVGTSAVRSRAVRFEEGGFGKGAGLRDALEALGSEAASGRDVRGAVLDFGGQVAIFGRTPSARRFEIADPDHRDRPALAVTIDQGSLSTSGNGVHPGHLLDPRTGEPATDFGSLTVWADDPLRADCLSTGLFVLGPEKALAWAEAHSDVEVAILERTADSPAGLRVRTSRGWAKKIEVLFETNRSGAAGRAGT